MSIVFPLIFLAMTVPAFAVVDRVDIDQKIFLIDDYFINFNHRMISYPTKNCICNDNKTSLKISPPMIPLPVLQNLTLV